MTSDKKVQGPRKKGREFAWSLDTRESKSDTHFPSLDHGGELDSLLTRFIPLTNLRETRRKLAILLGLNNRQSVEYKLRCSRYLTHSKIMSQRYRRYLEKRTHNDILEDASGRRKSNIIVLPSVWDGREDTDSEFLSLTTEPTEVSLPSITLSKSLRNPTPEGVIYSQLRQSAQKDFSKTLQDDADDGVSSQMSRLGQDFAGVLTVSSCSFDELNVDTRNSSLTANQRRSSSHVDIFSEGEDNAQTPTITERTGSKYGCCTCRTQSRLTEHSRRQSDVSVMDTSAGQMCLKCGKARTCELSRTKLTLQSPSTRKKSPNQSTGTVYSVQETTHSVESPNYRRHKKKPNRGFRKTGKMRTALTVGANPLPNVDTDIHRDAYSHALSDSGALRFSKDPWSLYMNYSRPYFSYFPVWRNPLPLGEMNLQLGLKPRKMKLNVKNGMKHILGPVQIRDYYPGGKKFPAKIDDKPSEDREQS